jgi:hypothetical protein
MNRAAWVRTGLFVVGVPAAVTGGWALLAPRSFYDDFPGSGKAWIAAYGPFDEHLVRDVGGLMLAISLATLIAAILMDRRLIAVIVSASLVYDASHLAFHASERGGLSTRDYAVNVILLAVIVLIKLAILVDVAPPRRREVVP